MFSRRNEFGDLVSKPGLQINPHVPNAMPQIVPDVINRGTLGRGKSHHPSLVAERVAWPTQASGSSFACLDPGALALQFGFDEPQIAPHSDFSEKGKIFHNQTGEFELLDPYQISNSSSFAQPEFDASFKPPPSRFGL
ncbi:uncharacterized protein N7477_002362 [Penicillium maclennaniae]|uniref:uncharacterized protein n=1 Tax=Penicillium maclennaniae TaxID=1343394 RepID=UPI002540A8F6|nr:uncharacterized protein N7477_002362 [Penicillium maclennaniae]KAJ5676729.1 hypothetical protein N7477_002362 [Penicillium maclennaniae]